MKYIILLQGPRQAKIEPAIDQSSSPPEHLTVPVASDNPHPKYVLPGTSKAPGDANEFWKYVPTP